jgi:hypothetical protein
MPAQYGCCVAMAQVRRLPKCLTRNADATQYAWRHSTSSKLHFSFYQRTTLVVWHAQTAAHGGNISCSVAVILRRAPVTVLCSAAPPGFDLDCSPGPPWPTSRPSDACVAAGAVVHATLCGKSLICVRTGMSVVCDPACARCQLRSHQRRRELWRRATSLCG